MSTSQSDRSSDGATPNELSPNRRASADDRAASLHGLTEHQAWTLDWQSTNLAPLLRAVGRRQAVESYWVRYRCLDRIRAAIGFRGDTRVLDVGCGLATVLATLPGTRVGLDHLAREYAALLPPPPGVVMLAAAAEALPFGEATFDVVVCSNALDHFNDPATALREVHRVLCPGGWLVLTCEVADATGGSRNAGHPQSLTASDLECLLRGWTVVQSWRSPFVGVAAHLRGETTGRHTELGYLARRG